MKHTSKHLIVTLAAGLLFGLAADAFARHPFGRPGFRPDGPRPGAAIGDPAELAAHRDEFASYRLTKLLGSAYYAKRNFRLHAEHAAIYELIGATTTGDRLNESLARTFVDRLVAIGTEAKTLLGSAEALSDADAAVVKGKLDALRAEVAKAVANKVEPDEVSVTINRNQWLMDELHRFAVAESVLSSGKASSLRRKLDTLERHEQAAKQDNSLSEGEREKLLKETRETWRWCAEAFS